MSISIYCTMNKNMYLTKHSIPSSNQVAYNPDISNIITSALSSSSSDLATSHHLLLHLFRCGGSAENDVLQVEFILSFHIMNNLLTALLDSSFAPFVRELMGEFRWSRISRSDSMSDETIIIENKSSSSLSSSTSSLNSFRTSGVMMMGFGCRMLLSLLLPPPSIVKLLVLAAMIGSTIAVIAYSRTV